VRDLIVCISPIEARWLRPLRELKAGDHYLVVFRFEPDRHCVEIIGKSVLTKEKS